METTAALPTIIEAPDYHLVVEGMNAGIERGGNLQYLCQSNQIKLQSLFLSSDFYFYFSVKSICP